MKVLKRTVHWNGMAWPRYRESYDDSVQWRLRYGANPPSREDILHAASVMAAYTALVATTYKNRSHIVGVLKRAEEITPDTNLPKETK